MSNFVNTDGREGLAALVGKSGVFVATIGSYYDEGRSRVLTSVRSITDEGTVLADHVHAKATHLLNTFNEGDVVVFKAEVCTYTKRSGVVQVALRRNHHYLLRSDLSV